MTQYSKDVFNIAPGLGRAIDDPREAEARAREASARAERDLGSQIQSRLEAQRLQQQQIELSAQQQLAQQGQFNRQLEEQTRQFDTRQSGASQEAEAQRAFQQLMQGEQLDSQEARFNAQGDYQQGRDQTMDARYQQGLSREDVRNQTLDDRYNQQFAYQQGRDVKGDEFRDKKFTYQQGRDVKGDEFRQQQAESSNFFRGLDYNQRVELSNQADRHFNANRADANERLQIQQRMSRQQQNTDKLLGIITPLMQQETVSNADLRQAARMGAVLGIEREVTEALRRAPRERKGFLRRVLGLDQGNTLGNPFGVPVKRDPGPSATTNLFSRMFYGEAPKVTGGGGVNLVKDPNDHTGWGLPQPSPSPAADPYINPMLRRMPKR